jgi:hypothetical protein
MYSMFLMVQDYSDGGDYARPAELPLGDDRCVFTFYIFVLYTVLCGGGNKTCEQEEV